MNDLFEQSIEASIAKRRKVALEMQASGDRTGYELYMMAAITLQDVLLAYTAERRETIRRKDGMTA